MGAEAENLNMFLGEQARANRERAAMLSDLLSTEMARRGFYLAFASAMGKTGYNGSPGVTSVPSYTVLHSLEWISQNILLGSEMPFMANKIDQATGRLVVDWSNADEVKQRAPDWTRQAALAAYLAQPERKFGPIMAVVNPEWVDDARSDYWDGSGRATITAADFTAVEPGARVGLLKLDGVRLYALDGQHRVLGIRGLRELRDLGLLQLRAHDGTPRGGTMSKAEFFQSFRLAIEDLQDIFNDTMPVEYTPAVIKGETRAEATRRIRRTFIAINSYAKKTDKGENILLDETDGYAIVARRVGVAHPLFKSDGVNQKVNWKGPSILSGSSHLTTLSTLKEAAMEFLPRIKPEVFGQWRAPLRGMVPMRPAGSELEFASEVMFDLFSHIGRLPIFQTVERAGAVQYNAVLNRWRDFPDYDVLEPRLLAEPGVGRSRGHLLLRPLGQIILVKAVAELAAAQEHGGHGLEMGTVFKAIGEIDSRRGFEMARHQSVWYGVTYGAVRGRIIVRNKSWAHRLLVHLVARTREEREANGLWKNWVGSRVVDLSRRTWRDLSGEVSEFSWDVSELPTPVLR